jgi:2-oxoglutarate dehydrogenase E1 component
VLGKFRSVVWDRDRTWPEKVTRLLLCSGKIYYDIIASPRRAATPHVKIGRIELLYPFPGAEIGEYVRRYPNLKEVVWVQEEPRNMGARKFVLPKIREVLPSGVALLDVSRPERSSPAEGYPAAHKAEQERIVAAAYGS